MKSFGIKNDTQMATSVNEMTVGLSYRIQTGTNFDKVFEYKGPEASGRSSFTCKYGAIWSILCDSCTITGPVPKDTLTEAEVQHQWDLYARYCGYVARLDYYNTYFGEHW